MAFPNQTPRVYNRINVEKLNPGQKGVYGLYREGLWIYIGKGDIRDRLLAHINGDNPRITRNQPSRYVSEITDNMDNREKQLIREFTPVCNERVG